MAANGDHPRPFIRRSHCGQTRPTTLGDPRAPFCSIELKVGPRRPKHIVLQMRFKYRLFFIRPRSFWMDPPIP
jgi:hypothetical protein